jgi:hypothetical protein
VIFEILSRLAGRPEPRPDVPPGIRVVRGDWIPALGGWLSGMRGRAAAVTLGRVVVVRPGVALTPGLLRHELAHVQQWARHPLSFPVRYVWHHFRHGYEANPFEIEARAAERSSDRRQS